jgi:hypothetical protein
MTYIVKNIEVLRREITFIGGAVPKESGVATRFPTGRELSSFPDAYHLREGYRNPTARWIPSPC